MPKQDAIELTVLRSMTIADLDAAHALSVEAGWPHRPDDWRLALEMGHGVVATDEGGRIMASAIWWPFGCRLATIGLVIVSPRLQGRGTGRRMMRELFAAAGARTIRLVATAAGQRLYESEGFQASATIAQHQGIASKRAAVEDTRVRPAHGADWAAIATLDGEAFGGDRRRALDVLSRVGAAHVLVENGRIAGYSVCRPFGRGHVVGPLVAADGKAAVALASPHVAAHAGSFLRIDTPERNAVFADFIEASGLAQVDRVVQMTRGPSPEIGPVALFALASQALG